MANKKAMVKYPKLKALLCEKGLTQQEFSKIIGIGYDAFSFKINGKRKFTIDEIEKILKFFQKSFEEIFLPT
jgi:predicted transcriptional regulator